MGFIDCTSRKSARNGRALDLDAILEGRIKNHIIGERQSRMLNLDSENVTTDSLNKTLESTNENDLSSNKTAKLINDEESMQKHASFISHYANEEEEQYKSDKLKKSIDNLDQYMDTLPRVVNNDPPYPQPSSVSYLNPVYPNEDKILAALIGQAASNIASSGQPGDLNAAQSNPPPIYASSADKPLPVNNGASSNQNNPNKKRPFASIGSSLQEFVSSFFPTKVTNKFINRRKQNGQNNANQIDFASFASECICVPFYMCNRGYIEQNAKLNQQTNSLSSLASTPIAGISALSSSVGSSGFDQKKVQNIYDTTGLTPAALELIENTSSSLDKLYNPQRLAILANQYQDIQQAASSLAQQNAYPINLNQQNSQFNLGAHQQGKENRDNPQSLPTPLPMTISRRTQNNDQENLNDQEANKNASDNLGLPIDERSIDGKIDFNQTEGLEVIKKIKKFEISI